MAIDSLVQFITKQVRKSTSRYKLMYTLGVDVNERMSDPSFGDIHSKGEEAIQFQPGFTTSERHDCSNKLWTTQNKYK